MPFHAEQGYEMNISPTTYCINIAMAKLGISRSTLYRVVDKGHLELIKISGPRQRHYGK